MEEVCPSPDVEIQAIWECNAQGTTWLFFPSIPIQQSASSSLPTKRCGALTALGTPQLSALIFVNLGESTALASSQMWFSPLNPKCSSVKSEAFCSFSTGCTKFLPSWLQQRQGIQLEGKVFFSISCAIKHWNNTVVSWIVCVWHMVSERAQLCALSWAGEHYSWVITCSWQMVEAYEELDLWYLMLQNKQAGSPLCACCAAGAGGGGAPCDRGAYDLPLRGWGTG